MMRSFCAAVAAVVLALAVSSPTAFASDTDEARAKDRAEIQALMWRYVRALDTFNPEAYAASYTEDGQFSAGQNVTKGRAALIKMVADLRKGREDRAAKGEKVPPIYHTIANSNLEFTGKDTARFESYWVTVYAGVGPDTPTRVASVGRGIDELVRQNGRWLIKSRDVAPKD